MDEPPTSTAGAILSGVIGLSSSRASKPDTILALVSQILGNPLDHFHSLVAGAMVVRVHWAGFGVRGLINLTLTIGR